MYDRYIEEYCNICKRYHIVGFKTLHNWIYRYEPIFLYKKQLKNKIKESDK